MILTCLGHAKFLIELESGLRVVTDPYDGDCGYPVASVACDVALVSHHHHDHDAVETLTGSPRIIDRAGAYALDSQARLTAVPAWHDDVQGAKRGDTLLFLLEAEGLRLAHLGDLGCPLTAEQREALAPVDVLMLPVGGYYTIDVAQARDTALQLGARMILPMHYRTAWTADWPIAPVETFTSLYPNVPEPLPLVRVTRADLPCQPPVAVLLPQVEPKE